ncbi:MAG TPA: hypothetical protein VG294_03630, partial [Solirubrobacteraceae bacterium]|nr:hypothetical protein [Solirubrobacteraceae bacterium]
DGQREQHHTTGSPGDLPELVDHPVDALAPGHEALERAVAGVALPVKGSGSSSPGHTSPQPTQLNGP